MSTPSPSVVHAFAGYHPLLAQKEAYTRTIVSGVYLPYCVWSVVLCSQPKCATGFFDRCDPNSIPTQILAWSMVKGKRRRKGRCSIFVYGSSIQEARPFPPAVLVRSLFCYTPFCFQVCVKNFYFLICSCQLYGKKAGKTACRGLAYQQLPECLGD